MPLAFVCILLGVFGGYLPIGSAPFPCVLGWGVSVQIVVWLGLLSVAAALLVALLAWAFALALVIAAMAPPVSLAPMLLSPAAQA